MGIVLRRSHLESLLASLTFGLRLRIATMSISQALIFCKNIPKSLKVHSFDNVQAIVQLQSILNCSTALNDFTLVARYAAVLVLYNRD